MDEQVIDTPDIPEYGGDTEQVSEAETQAGSLGWKPQDQFKGDPDKWTDAETFLELHSRNNGALREANKKQAAKLAEMERRIAQNEAMSKSIFDQQIKKQKEEFDNQLAFLKAQKRNALRDGDHDTAETLDDQIDELKTRGPEVPDVQPKQNPEQKDWREIPELADFAERNTWFEKDEDMTEFSVARATSLRKKNPKMDMVDLLKETEAAVRKAFPHKFPGTVGTRRDPVEAGERASSATTSARSYQAMPKDAREACDEFVADKLGKREDYVKMYFEYDDKRRGA